MSYLAGRSASPAHSSRSASPDGEGRNPSSPSIPRRSLSPVPSDLGLSPSASTFLRTAETLEGLAQQLSTLSDVDDGLPEGKQCCCVAVEGRGGARCRVVEERDRMSAKLVLSGEIGNALLHRYEALEKKHAFEVKRLQHQLEVKRTAVTESARRLAALDKANGTHLGKYADLNRKYEALEKRYTQALHTQTLTQQSLTHVRSELTSLRSTMQRQSIALVSGASNEDRLADVERRYEDARESQLSAERASKDEQRKRARAEMRIAELEEQLRISQRETDDVKESRTKDAQAVLDNAKSRLETLHQELSETFRADSPSEQPEYLKAMEGLVADNAMLKHDTTELTHLLAESKDEVRILRDEVEDLRGMASVAGRISPSVPPHLAAELRKSYHGRTESSPNVGTFDRSTWARMSVSSSTRWDHNRRSSFAPSFASTSTTDGLTSPGLGLGSIGEFGGALSREGALSPPPGAGDGKDSPKQGAFRTSPSTGIGYMLNGVPKMGPVKPQYRRRASERPRLPSRSYTSQGVESIAEAAAPESDMGHTTDEPPSPASATFRAADLSRKRRSLMLQRYHSASPHESTDYSIAGSQTLVDHGGSELMSPLSDSVSSTAIPPKPSPAKAANRKTLLLLTKSKGTQTDDIELGGETIRTSDSDRFRDAPTVISTGTSPRPEDRSETSSVHHSSNGALMPVVDQLSKLLGRLRAADILTLNKRLKKQHLPGDVSHLSRSTLRALQAEIGDIKHLSRLMLDSTGIQRKEWNSLFKLLRDVFTELVDLQAVINDVTLEPKLAKRLQKDAFRDEEAEEAALAAAAAGGGVGGLGWIANPITRLFVTPAAGPTADPKHASRVERGKLQAGPSVKAAPKQAAVAGATTTHVSVEFGGAGIVRRATPAQSSSSSAAQVNTADALPASPNPMMQAAEASRQVSSRSVATVASTGTDPMGTTRTLRPPAPPGTLRPRKSRANRDELLGIFAGAGTRQAPLVPSGGIGHTASEYPGSNAVAGPSRLRTTSSQHFQSGGERTVRARESGHRRRLSAVVDAVIDTNVVGVEHPDEAILEGEEEEQSFQPLLARTLRPRGLSDSSIRSTFVSHAGPSELLPAAVIPPVDTGPAVRQGGYAGGLLAGIGRRLYWNNKNEVSPINPIDSPPPPPPHMSHSRTRSQEIKHEIKQSPTAPSKPIAVSPSPSKNAAALPADRPGSVTTSLGASLTGTTGGGGGFLGRLLASSLAADSMTLVEDSDDEGGGEATEGWQGRTAVSPGGRGTRGGFADRMERQEMVGASLRQGVVLGRSLSRSGARWE